MKHKDDSESEMSIDELLEWLFEEDTSKNTEELSSEPIEEKEIFTESNEEDNSDDNSSQEADIILAQLNEVRKSVLPHAREVMKTNREDVFEAIHTALHVVDVAFYDGLDPLINEGSLMASSDSATKKLFALGLRENSLVYQTSIPEMLEEYERRPRNIVEDYISYMYMRTMFGLHVGLNPRLIRIILRSMLPPEERKRFDNYKN